MIAAGVAAAAVYAVDISAYGPAFAEEDGRSGTLVAAVDIQPKSLDPIMGDNATTDRLTLNQIYETLVWADSNGELRPGLASSWEYTDAGSSIVFKLREGVKFHDGTMFDANTAAWNIRRAIDPAVNAPKKSQLAEVESVEVVEPQVLKVNLKAKSGAALASFALDAGMMVSPTAAEKAGEAFGRNPVGTGPFQFYEWVSGSEIRLKAFDDYWQEGPEGQDLPLLDGVTIRFVTSTAVKLIEVQSGNVHLVDGITPKDFASVEADPDLVLVEVPGGFSQWVSFNVTKHPFNDEKLRRAVSLALDRTALAQAVVQSYGTVIPTLIAPFDWAADPAIAPLQRDISEAQRLLESSEAKSGFSPTLTIIQRDPDTTVAQLMQAQLQEAGIPLKIEVLERQGFVSKVLNYDYEIAMGRMPVPLVDPDHVFRFIFGRDAQQNYPGHTDEELFALIDQARAETDRTERKNLYSEIQKRLLEKNYLAFLFLRQVRHVASSDVQGLEYDLMSGWRLHSASLNN